ncbi:translation protein [Piptocephalis cylindrospora]|uniref:Large ribosomal subunit protein uL3m n=1 Tax=Piptocephalis cylindrospora TaxID=1907219 RepID=A0A4P9Y2N5_9FUNG|nr:translation protein [Piptocephalis cylindrospora]|eukprot:RKP13043.1 translation protein [Piptocephalis cylindrospora]
MSVTRSLNRLFNSLSLGRAGARSFASTTPATPVFDQQRTVRTGLLARKKGMASMFDEWGVRHPVTVLHIDEVQVTNIVSQHKGAYLGVEMGAGSQKAQRLTKPMQGHLARANAEPKKKIAQFPISTLDAAPALGSTLNAAHFLPGQFVDVSANSIGKGFAGAMKRWGFKGLRASHGVSVSHRSMGSTGQCQDPGRVFKGKKMPGRMGGKRVTVQNLRVMKVDVGLGLIYVRGCIPGVDDAWVRVKDSVKKRGLRICFPPSEQVPYPSVNGEDALAQLPRERIAKMGGADPMLQSKN